MLLACHAGCETGAILDRAGLTWADLFTDNGRSSSNGDDWMPGGLRAIATYEYTNANGKVIFGVCRTADKQFRQWQPDASQPGGRRWSVKGVTLTIYRLPRVLAAIDAGQSVYVVEGEKDVQALESASVTATCNPGGAGKWRSHYSKHLQDAEVVIVADNDDPGCRHARQVAEALDGVAASVRLVRAATGKDATDHLAAGHGIDDFVALEDAPTTRSTGVVGAPVNGANLLDDVEEALGRYVAFPSEAARVAVTLWAAHAHAVDCFDSTPRLALLSPEPGSGKTRCLEVLELLTPQPLLVLNASTAATFRTIQAEQPTLLFDEVDTIFTKRGKDDQNEDLRALLNAGHRKGMTIPRCVGQQQEVVRFPVFAATALAGLGDLPATLMTRSAVIRMRRRTANEQVEPFRERIASPQLTPLRDRLATWAMQIDQRLRTSYPELPNGVTDRPADVWEPLVAVADAAGGKWPARAREACVELIKSARTDAMSLGVRLLTDLRTVFDGCEHLSTREVIERLWGLDESPWGGLYGSGLNARGLAKLLEPYGVKSKTIRVGSGTPRGYVRADLHDPWSRYLPVTPAEAQHPQHAQHPRSGGVEPVADTDGVADGSATGSVAATPDPPVTCAVADVAHVADLRGEPEGSSVEDDLMALLDDDPDFEAVLSNPAPPATPAAEQPTLDATPGDDLPEGWTRFAYTLDCAVCGQPCRISDPHHVVLHPKCLRPDAPQAVDDGERDPHTCRRCQAQASPDNPIDRDGVCDECVVAEVVADLRQEGQTVAEMAEVVGWPEGRVEGLLRRCSA